MAGFSTATEEMVVVEEEEELGGLEPGAWMTSMRHKEQG